MSGCSDTQTSRAHGHMLSSAPEDVSHKLDVMCFAHTDTKTTSRTLESFMVPRGAADKIYVRHVLCSTNPRLRRLSVRSVLFRALS